MTALKLPAASHGMDLHSFERILVDRRRTLLKDAQALEREEEAAADNNSRLSSHLAELGTDRSTHDVSLGCMESITKEIQEIDAALQRLHEGTFGLCETCGEKLSKARLDAIPYARLCIGCKRAEEAF
jgi:DnaK suppressor protein